jgi:hypothetical protein
LKEDMTKFRFGHAIAGRHEPSSDMASSSDGLFKLLNIVDDCCKVGAEDGVGGTDAEAGPLNIGKMVSVNCVNRCKAKSPSTCYHVIVLQHSLAVQHPF